MQVITLLSNEVHVWQADLPCAAQGMHCLSRLLSEDERARAHRFRSAQDRDRFIVSHGFVRTVLGWYLGIDPEQLAFCQGPHGKPTLALEHDGKRLRFNLSHSHELALLAVAEGREVGVDAEYARAKPSYEEIARRFFSSEEAAALNALPPPLRSRAFYICWTRKEAYLKARGDGLAFPLDRVRASHPDEPPSLLSVGNDLAEAARWSLCDLTPAAGYVGAVAVRGEGASLRLWRWPST